MPDYEDILSFLAANPPHLDAERELHASLLELLAQYLRAEQSEPADDDEECSEMLQALGASHVRWGRVH
jgi:hypothetical protein